MVHGTELVATPEPPAPKPADAQRGGADPAGPERVDLAAGRQHPPGLDVTDAVPLHVRQAGGARSVRLSSPPRRALQQGFPDRNGGLDSRCGSISCRGRYPRPWQWIVVGLVALAVPQAARSLLLLALPLGALLVVLVNALGLFTDLAFVLPVAPAFVLLGVGALLGPRSPRSAVEPAR